jgi:hypothetical protein
MKIKRKGLMIVAVALLMVAVIVPVYALGDQSGIMKCPRDQANEDPPGPTTRSYGENSQNPEGLSGEETLEETETPIQEQKQEQTQKQEQLRDGDCENADCEQYQYQYQHKEQHQYQHGQEEQD